MQLNTVVLPAPLGPMMLWIEPSLDLEIELVDGDEAAEALRHLLLLRRMSSGLLISPARFCFRLKAGGLGGRGFGIDLHLASLGRRWPQAFRLEAHDDDDGQAVEQEAEFAELAQGFRQADQYRRAEHDARQAPHAADDDQGQYVDRNDELKRVRVDGSEHGGEDRTGKSGESGTQAIGEQLHADEIDAKRLGDVFVVADRHPGAAKARVLEPPGEIGGD